MALSYINLPKFNILQTLGDEFPDTEIIPVYLEDVDAGIVGNLEAIDVGFVAHCKDHLYESFEEYKNSFKKQGK